MLPRKRWLLLAAGALALGGTALWATSSTGVLASAPVAAPVPEASLYSVKWSASERRAALELGDKPVTHRVVLEGTLTLAEAEGGALEGRLVRVDQFSLEMLGQPVSLDARLLTAPFRLEREQGIPERILFPPDTEPLVEHLLQALAVELDVPRRVDAPTLQRSRLGPVTVELTEEGAALVRRRLEYRASPALADLDLKAQNVHSRAEVRLEKGQLQSVEAQEVLELRGAHFEDSLRLERLGASGSIARATRWAAPREVASVVPKTQLDQKLLEQRAEGLSSAQLLEDLRALGNGGRMPHHDRWLWQAVARLRLDPGLASELEKVFGDPQTNATHRMLIVDLLASAGTPVAQATLLRLLDGPIAAGDPERLLMQQRLSFVTEPAPATVQWLERRYASTQGDAKSAAAASLGAAAGHLMDQGQAEQAQRLNRLLTGALEGAKEVSERESLLDALGNAGLSENRALLEKSLGAKALSERRAALLALRKDTSAEATALLTRMAQDGPLSPDAFTLLTQRELTPAQAATVIEQLRGGSGSLQGDLAAVSFLSRYLDQDPNAREVLLLISARHPQEASLRSQIASMLAHGEGPGE